MGGLLRFAVARLLEDTLNLWEGHKPGGQISIVVISVFDENERLGIVRGVEHLD